MRPEQITLVQSSFAKVAPIAPATQRLAGRRVAYGARPAHYAVVGAALLDALARGRGEAFTEAPRVAWTAAYPLLSGLMIEAQGAAEGT